MFVPTSRRGSGLRWVTAAAAAVALLGASGCGSSAGDEALPASTVTAPPPPVLDQDQLEGALLGLGDLTPGWSEAESSDSDESSIGQAGIFCPEGEQASGESTSQVSWATVSYEMADGVPALFQGLVSDDDGAALFAEIDAVPGACLGSTWTADLDGRVATLTMTEVSGASAGDQTTNYRMDGTAEADGVPIALTVEITVVQRDTVVQLYLVTAATAPLVDFPEVPPAEFAQIVEAGDQNVAEALVASGDEA